jgi:hypothetical protein
MRNLKSGLTVMQSKLDTICFIVKDALPLSALTNATFIYFFQSIATFPTL